MTGFSLDLGHGLFNNKRLVSAPLELECNTSIELLLNFVNQEYDILQ